MFAGPVATRLLEEFVADLVEGAADFGAAVGCAAGAQVPGAFGVGVVTDAPIFVDSLVHGIAVGDDLRLQALVAHFAQRRTCAGQQLPFTFRHDRSRGRDRLRFLR